MPRDGVTEEAGVYFDVYCGRTFVSKKNNGKPILSLAVFSFSTALPEPSLAKPASSA